MARGSPTWQELEAPLFSMRSMGGEVNPDDDEILPHIMDMLPNLPDHPRIRYAAILVISRYTQWIDRHPSNIAFQLQYISLGFHMAEEEVSAAAAQAMKFMCQDCSQHLIPFLPQLHDFVATVGDKLDQPDMIEVCEAIGYIIDGMPPDQAAPALQQFCQPLLERIQAVAAATTPLDKPELQKAADALEQINAFLRVVRTINPLPESCYPTALAVYQVLDSLLQKYAKLYFMSDRIGSVLRRGLLFFPPQALEPVLQPLLERMVSCFELTEYATFLWIVGKVASKFGDLTRGPGGEVLAGLLVRTFESMTTQLSKVLNGKTAVEIPDGMFLFLSGSFGADTLVMEDFVHTFIAYITFLPHATLSSPLLHLAVSHTLAALSCPAPETNLVCLDALAILSKRLGEQAFQSTLQPIFAQYGKAIVALLIQGMVADFVEDGLDQVQTVLAATVVCAPAQEVDGWVVEAVGGIAGHIVPLAEKQRFLEGVRA
jgi:transportin-3